MSLLQTKKIFFPLFEKKRKKEHENKYKIKQTKQQEQIQKKKKGSYSQVAHLHVEGYFVENCSRKKLQNTKILNITLQANSHTQ